MVQDLEAGNAFADLKLSRQLRLADDLALLGNNGTAAVVDRCKTTG